jgi:hypothetical protein
MKNRAILLRGLRRLAGMVSRAARTEEPGCRLARGTGTTAYGNELWQATSNRTITPAREIRSALDHLKHVLSRIILILSGSWLLEAAGLKLL